MPGTNNIKYINSLKQKKFRQKHGVFVVEGEKMVNELLQSRMEIISIYATDRWLKENEYNNEFPGNFPTGRLQKENLDIIRVSGKQMERISSLTTPAAVLALVRIPSYEPDISKISCSLSLVLDRVQDPGNLGTLIRSADWFGVDTIILSEDSAEITNPKVVQATMGSIFRIRFHYADLPSLLSLKGISGVPVYGAFPGSPPVWDHPLSPAGLIVLGNESRGISPKVEKLVTDRIGIPPGRLSEGAESLNIAVAGSIILSEFKRKGRVNSHR